jgi:hypothetical protein
MAGAIDTPNPETVGRSVAAFHAGDPEIRRAVDLGQHVIEEAAHLLDGVAVAAAEGAINDGGERCA